MSRMFQASLLHAALLTAIAFTAHAAEFVYQGQLDDRGVPANGRYDLRIAAYGDEKSAAGLMTPIEFPAVEVKDGRFELRFDAPLARAREAWLEVAVRDVGAGNFATIPGRSKAISAPLIGACWSTTGDTGSSAATNFLGTTDDEPLVLRVNNQQALRIEPGLTSPNLIGGSSGNFAASGVYGATIGGGGEALGANRVTDNFSTVSGGWKNEAGDGDVGTGTGQYATVGGGVGNTASGYSSTNGGGFYNVASGTAASVGGGAENQVFGNYAAVPGGHSNQASGDFSFASGRRALASHAGTFVWADSQNVNFVSTDADQFLVRAQGGVAINTNAPTAGSALTVAGNVSIPAASLAFGSITRQMLNLYSTTYGIGVQTSTQYFRAGSSGQFAWFKGGVHSDAALDPGAGGSLMMTLGPTGSTPTGTARAQEFTNVSDRAAKTGFAPIDAGEVLARVAQLPLSAWSYRNAPEVRHIGPVAQDFRAAFGLGDDERTISTVDSAGVALAAIQGLNAKLEAENAALRVDNAAIRSELDALRSLVESRLNAEH